MIEKPNRLAVVKARWAAALGGHALRATPGAQLTADGAGAAGAATGAVTCAPGANTTCVPGAPDTHHLPTTNFLASTFTTCLHAP